MTSVLHPRGLPPTLARLQRTLVLGIVNVTPDSFADGGLWLDPAAAVAHGIALHRNGADIVDVGGESTRPGAMRVDMGSECARIEPVVAGLVAAGVPVSIDTMRAEVAAVALNAGACMVNDVSGGVADPTMLPWLATVDIPFIVMHWRGPSAVMSELAVYTDVVAEVIAELQQRLAAVKTAGIDLSRVVIDPGIGFSKEAEHNWALLHHIDRLIQLGYPVALGASRKRFIGALLANAAGEPRPVQQRDYATDAITALAAAQGVWGVRVHDVSGSRDCVAAATAWRNGEAHGSS